MRVGTFLFVSAFVLVCSSPAFAQKVHPDDAEGCKDAAVMKNRMPGAWITECEAKEFDKVSVQVAKTAGDEAKYMKALEGKTEMVAYMCPDTTTPTQISRNAEAALKAAGFSILFTGLHSENDAPAVTAQKGNTYVQVMTSTGEHSYHVLTVQVKEMAQDLEANAAAMEAEINKTGRVAVYGITFDTGKATIKPESAKVLGEIAALLKKNADWKLRVDGHTDNVGAKAMNQTLSEQRAAAVVAWLAKNGIDKSRLTSQGFGDAQPIGDNATDEGRAKNRRVELVKQ